MQTKLSGKSKKASLELWGSTILFIVLAIVIILPIWLLLIASFKPGGDLLQYGLNLDINFSRMSLDNFVLLFTGQHEYLVLQQYLFNGSDRTADTGRKRLCRIWLCGVRV